MLRLVYYTLRSIFAPFESLWKFFFSIPLKNIPDKIVIFDAIGGSGKTTLSKDICNVHGHKHIRLDDCKYGAAWRRFTPEEFVSNLNNQLNSSNGWYVVEGTFDDQHIQMCNFLRNSMVIYNDLPKWIAQWRKLFRSFKRYIGVEEQGTAVETWHNVKEMLKKGNNTYDDRYKLIERTLNIMFKECMRIKWPYFYTLR